MTERPFPAFHIWPWPKHVFEITASMRYPSGGVAGEITFNWTKIGSETYLRLEMFSDAWRLFNVMPKKLWPALAELCGTNPTPEQMIDFLLQLGFKDTDPEATKAYRRKAS